MAAAVNGASGREASALLQAPPDDEFGGGKRALLDVIRFGEDLERCTKEIVRWRDQDRNPSIHRAWQRDAAAPIKHLLSLTEDYMFPVRRHALEALTKAAEEGGEELSALLPASGKFDTAVLVNMQPVTDPFEQQEHTNFLTLTSLVAAAVPEAEAFVALVPRLVAFAANQDPGFPPYSPFWCIVMKTLLALSFAESQRRDIAQHLSAVGADVVLSGGGLGSNPEPFLTGLLFANICDLIPAGGSATFGHIASSFWSRQNFAEEFASKLAEAIELEESRHRAGSPSLGANIVGTATLPWHSCYFSWRLASSARRLALAGHADVLHHSVGAFVACATRVASLLRPGLRTDTEVDDRAASRGEDVGVDVTMAADKQQRLRTARLALVALRALVDQNTNVCQKVLDTDGARVLATLEALCDDEPAAADLLESLRGFTGPPTVTSRSPVTGPFRLLAARAPATAEALLSSQAARWSTPATGWKVP